MTRHHSGDPDDGQVDKPVNPTATGAGLVLLTLASAQFLMTLDLSLIHI